MNFSSLSPRKRKEQKAKKLPLLPTGQPQKPLQINPRTMKPVGQPGPMKQPIDPRKMIVDQIIRDCYSKFYIKDGRQVPETKYNTHLGIREYSLYPQQPPPPDIPPSQVGAIKNRILVVCIKNSGRVLLQKGKYNDTKHVYQIGRTWDLDELQGISRVSPDSMILHLSKDYFWKSGEGKDRMMKFVHHMCVTYSKFIGRYPKMEGISPAELGLPPLGAPQPQQPQQPQQPPQQPQQYQQRAPPPGPNFDPSTHYKNLDFTASGKLPLKPMMVMDVDRPGASTSSLHTQDSLFAGSPAQAPAPTPAPAPSEHRSSHPYSQFSQKSLDAPDDSHSFIFDSEEAKPVQQMPYIPENSSSHSSRADRELREQARERAPENDSMSFKIDPNLVQKAPTTPNLIDEIEEVRDITPEQPRKMPLVSRQQMPGGFPIPGGFEEPAPAPAPAPAPVQNKEVDLNEASDDEQPSQVLSESTKIEPEEHNIESSIRDIENYMDNQLFTGRSSSQSQRQPEPKQEPAFEPPAPRQPRAQPEPESEPEYEQPPLQTRRNVEPEYEQPPLQTRREQPPLIDLNEEPEAPAEESESPLSYEDQLQSISIPGTPIEPETPATETGDFQFEKDAEIEEIFDEIDWRVVDTSDVFVRKLGKELDLIRRKNVDELTTLNFAKDSVSSEVENATGEVDNLRDIFKKMEVQFSLLAPQINHLQNNSQGLQVKSINKKILFNDLNEIINKVRVSSSDLKLISQYTQFENVDTIPALEKKLLALYEALGAIGRDEENDLSSMKALKQYQETYEIATANFVQHFLAFVDQEFLQTIEGLAKEGESLYPKNILVAFNVFLTYLGITSFLRCTLEQDLRFINDKMCSHMANFMDELLSLRTKHLKNSKTNIPNAELQKAKPSRFGSTRLINRLANDNHKPKIEALDGKNDGRILDPRIIMRMVDEAQELMLVVQYFFGVFFHYTFELEYAEYLREVPFKERVIVFDNPDLEQINYKTNSDGLLKSMTAIFGNYINRLGKKLVPNDLIVPRLLVELGRMIYASAENDQDFVCYNFLSKLADRYRNNWRKFITSQADMLDKLDIRVKAGVLPAIKNLNQIVYSTETTLQEAISHRDDGGAMQQTRELIEESYKELTDAAVELFSREDPLLKSNAHDDREKAHRNVRILQNVFTVTQQLDDIGGGNTGYMKQKFDETFSTAENDYIRYILHRNIGKVVDFVNSGSGHKHKKDDKILIKLILSTHGSKDMQMKISDIRRKMEKHFLTAENVFEQELLRKLWKDMENAFIAVFVDFDKIVRKVSSDYEMPVPVAEMRRMFTV